MTATTFIGHFLGPDVHASRPAAAGLPDGTMYVCTTHNKIERVISGAWVDYTSLGGAGVAADTIFDAKGDLVAATAADAAARLPVGANGYRLQADSTQTTGLKWVPPSKEWALKIVDDATTVTTGEDKLHIFLPASVNGYNLTGVFAGVSTVSSSGTPSIGIRNVTDAVEMLSTNVTIDATEKTSATAATAAVIDTAHDDVATGDELSVDVDTAGTGAKGLQMILTFTLP